MPRLGSNDYQLVVPTTWHDQPVHPFVERFYEGDNKLSLNRISSTGSTSPTPATAPASSWSTSSPTSFARQSSSPDNREIYGAYRLIHEKPAH